MTVRYCKGFTCDDCGAPRSDQSKKWCGECIKGHRGESSGYGAVVQTSEWEEEGGCLTRQHGDLEK